MIPATSERRAKSRSQVKGLSRLWSEFQDCSVSSWVAELVLALAWKLNEILTENKKGSGDIADCWDTGV